MPLTGSRADWIVREARRRPPAERPAFGKDLATQLLKVTLSLSSLLPTTKSVAQVLPGAESTPVFSVRFDEARSAAPLDGRLLVLLSTDPAEEPRFQINESPKTQIVFGMDVENWKPGETRTLEATNSGIFGYPIRSLRDLKPGEYTVQTLLDRYETFHRADGRVLKLPTDRGEGRKWNRAPGNLYSKPIKASLALPETDFRQSDGRDRFQGGRILA
jgi:hypothetical protein